MSEFNFNKQDMSVFSKYVVCEMENMRGICEMENIEENMRDGEYRGEYARWRI